MKIIFKISVRALLKIRDSRKNNIFMFEVFVLLRHGAVSQGDW
jgi:hypothetical protein